jgi:hypothetical protein
MSSARKAKWMKQNSIRVTKSDDAKLAHWLANFAADDVNVAYEGANKAQYAVGIETTRTFVDSKLENDLKYRMGIQEYYLGKAELRVVFDFNTQSSRKTRAREMLLRMNSVPVRFVRKLVKPS